MRKRIGVIGLLMLVALVPTIGCQDGVQPLWSQANAMTRIKVDPVWKTVELFNSKDVDVTLEGLSFTGGDNPSFAIDRLVFTDTASSVRLANVEQLKLVNAITDTAFRAFGDAMAKIMSEALSPVKGASATIDTPIGGGSITTGGGSLPAATQPAGP